MTKTVKILIIVLVALLISSALTIFIFLPMLRRKQILSTLKSIAAAEGGNVPEAAIKQGLKKLSAFEVFKLHRFIKALQAGDTETINKLKADVAGIVAKSGLNIFT